METMEEIYQKQIVLSSLGRCAQCRSKGDEMITCDRCDELRYCSIQCLVDDSEHHELFCNIVGINKGILYVRSKEEAEWHAKVMEKARLLNEDGSERLSSLCSDDIGIGNVQVEGTQSTAANKSESSRANKVKSGPDETMKTENESVAREDGRQRKGEQTLNEILKRGKFGGQAKVDSRVLSGESFGSGWWKAGKRDEREIQTSSSLTASATETGADSQAARKFTEHFNAGDTSDELVMEERPDATGQPVKASETTNCQLVTCDTERAGELDGWWTKTQRSTTGKCFFCEKEGCVLQCSGCRCARYCDSTCQKSHFPKHKDICRRWKMFDQALEKVPSKIAKQALTGIKAPSPFLQDLTDEFTYRMLGSGSGICTIFEIVDHYFHPFRHGVKVKDLQGQETFILFYNDTDSYRHVSKLPWPMTVMRLPLSWCIKPGNFIFLLDAHWHWFLDGKRGIRIDDLDKVHFILNDVS